MLRTRVVRRGLCLCLLSSYEKTLKSLYLQMQLQRHHFFLRYFKIRNVDHPLSGFEPATSSRWSMKTFRLYFQEKWQRCYPDWFSNGLGTLNKLTTSTARGFKTPINVVHYSVCSESPVVVWQPCSVTNRAVLSTRVILKFYRQWLTYNLRQNSWESCQSYVSLQDIGYKLTKLEFISSTLSPKPIVNCNLIFSVPQRPTFPRVGREG